MSIRARTLFALLCLLACPFTHLGAQSPAAAAPQAAPAPRSDLDAFMEKALARREVNRATLKQYVLDETETFEFLGPGRLPLQRTQRDFTWYVRDGMHVRSPLRVNGVGVGAADRDKYETSWIKRERARQERAAKKQKGQGEVAITSGGVHVETGAIPIPTEPRFVSEAYFMDFKFEPGNYYLAGREQLEGHEVLRIEYYPTRLFSATDEEKASSEAKKNDRQKRRDDKQELDINRKMNKTALVTLWVDPAEHQIVKYTFDNVWLDFLPGGWLVRIDDLRASMTMGQPFPGVWLPRDITIHAGATLANGSFEAAYRRNFAQYREATVKSTIRVPKIAQEPIEPDPQEEETPGGPYASREPRVASRDIEAQAEVIREVRVHGNAFLTDDEVLRLAGITVGDSVTAESLETVRQKLRDSGRFETIDVRKRYRSLDDPTDVAIVLVVHERPGVRAGAGGTVSDNPLRRFTRRLMFLPILGYSDGYGFTYGARVSTVDLLGAGERLSVPLTWGGTKRAALEFERPFKSGPLTRVTSSVAISNRENPYYRIDDERVELKAGAERAFARVFRTSVEATRSSVSFGTLDDRLWTFGADLALDTRSNPAYPSNGVFVGGGWSVLNVKGLRRINRYTGDLRGYLRVVGQAVIAARLQYFDSDAALPSYERLLLGGSPTLRGFRAGTYAADRMLVTGGELRIPITSVMSGAKIGMSVFMDAGKVVDFGDSLSDAEWHKGAGAGLFLIAPLVRINLDVARGIKGDTRVHLSTGFAF